MTTIVVMYTLRMSHDGTLEGPINKKVYASYAPKKHAVAIAYVALINEASMHKAASLFKLF